MVTLRCIEGGKGKGNCDPVEEEVVEFHCTMCSGDGHFKLVDYGAVCSHCSTVYRWDELLGGLGLWTKD